MAEPFVGEIRMFGFGRIPVGWLACNGAVVPIANYEVLYDLIGTAFGGDGRTTFGLPDLRGRAPIHQGSGQQLTPRARGQTGGAEEVTLTLESMPAHAHRLQASKIVATSQTPGPNLVTATLEQDNLYINDPAALTSVTLDPRSVGSAGSSQPHDNMMPSLTISYCIAWNGIYPPQA